MPSAPPVQPAPPPAAAQRPAMPAPPPAAARPAAPPMPPLPQAPQQAQPRPMPVAAPAAQPVAAAPVPAVPERRAAPRPAPSPAQIIGRVVSVAGCNTQVELAPHIPGQPIARAEIGSLAKIMAQDASVVGIISGMAVVPGQRGEKTVLEVILVGEVLPGGFQRGVSHFPSIGDDVFLAGGADLAHVYSQQLTSTLNVGTLYQDPSVSARLMADDLFSKHFAIVGTTGCGKSSALTCILREALKERPHAHVLVLDMHGEYHRAFGAQAEVIGAGDLHLPFWLLNFQELRSVLTSPDDHHDAQVEILCDAIISAKKRYSNAAAGRVRAALDTSTATVDSPTPFRLSDLISYIDEQLGKLERPYPTLAYRRLKSRIESLVSDPRYVFMFGNPNMEDTMVEIMARLFRIPNDGRPITVIELSTVPEEILDVVVLLLSRLTFDLTVWSNGGLPVLLVCEEAHRYVPADDRKGFFPTRQALSRIAKEGRKYGISLALLTQRPSELDTTILSQCSTILAMRLATESDQRVMRSNVHDSTFGILEYLPLLADREAIVLGRGAPMPMRIKFHELPATILPGKTQNEFTQRWATPNMDRRMLEDTVARWRSNSGRKT
jgi:DNA helicase HerA-like ATPase